MAVALALLALGFRDRGRWPLLIASAAWAVFALLELMAWRERADIRVDLLVTEGENEYVLEVNTLPGMTKTSLLPKIAEAAGYDFNGLCEAILDAARVYAAPRSRPRQASGNDFHLDELEPRRQAG